MKNYEHITNGSRIETISGYYIVTGWNGSIVYLDEYEPNDLDTDCIKTGESRLTLSELERVMKDFDGNNHSLVFDEGEM